MVIKKFFKCWLFVFWVLFGNILSFCSVKTQSPVLNFVMATDRGYLEPTIVTIHSIIKNCPDCPKHFIIFVGQDKYLNESNEKVERGSAPTEEDEKRLKKLTEINSSVQISLVDIPRESIQTLDDMISKDSSRLVCLRILIPRLFSERKVFDKSSNEIIGINDYFWVDSDVLVVKDLQSLYNECKEKGQPIIGANYLFIDCNLENPGSSPILYGKDGVCNNAILTNAITWKYQKQLSSQQSHNYFQISGGFVFINLEQMKGNQKNDSVKCPVSLRGPPASQGSDPVKRAVLPLPGSPASRKKSTSPLEQCFRMAKTKGDPTEEHAMGLYLQQCYKGDIFLLPTTYNCRLCYPIAASILLQNGIQSPSLRAIACGDVSIWHPDRETKFWQVGSMIPGSIEEVWWNYHDEVMHHLGLSYIRPPINNPATIIHNFSQLASASIGGRYLIQYENVNTEAELYELQNENENVRVVRVPVGSKNNVCSINVLGLPSLEYQQALILLQKTHHAAFVGLDQKRDLEFFQNIANQFNLDIRIYAYDNWWSRDPVAQFTATSTSSETRIVRMLYDRYHFTALIDVTENDESLKAFLENRTEEQGLPVFYGE